MKNRETTYYSLLSSERLAHIEQVADRLDEESFIELGYDRKWYGHLWIPENNECFLEYVGKQTDLQRLDAILGEQLKLYARRHREGFEKEKGDFYRVYKARKDWLKHTIFICKNEYNKTKKEIFVEAVKWCEDWQNEWLETFNPYSPDELSQRSESLKIPLWQTLTNDSNKAQEPHIMLGNDEVWFSEYELRQFIDVAVRWSVDGVFKNCTERTPFSIFDNDITHARANFELFSRQLNRRLTETQNWKAIEVDVKDRFLPMIEQYLIWYEENKPEFEKFEPYNPYSLMRSVIESTKKEILKYFPEKVADEGMSLIKFFANAGMLVRPSKIEFHEDGTNKIIEWSVGKTTDEVYEEKTQQIKKEVEELEAKCFSKDLENAELNLLAQQLKEYIYIYRYKNSVFENNPEQQRNIQEYFNAAANRLESLLNDVVLPKIEYRNNKIINIEYQGKAKPTITAYALMHAYLSMFGGQPVTQQNKNELVIRYGYSSGQQLRNEFTAFQKEDRRREMNTTNKRSANTHLERYKSILPLLEAQNKAAYEEAKKDYEYLQKEYRKYH